MSLAGLLLKGFGPTTAADPPDEPTLVVSDNGNGTATGTISDSTAGSSNTVYTAAFTGDSGQLGGWSSAGTRSGNGNVTITRAAGYYMVYVLSTVSSQTKASEPVYLRITDGTAAVATSIRQAVLARLQSMTFAAFGDEPVGSISTRHMDYFKDADKAPGLPGLLITVRRSTENPMDGENVRDDITYHVVVQILAQDSGHRHEGLDTYDYWAEQIAWTFRHQPLTDVTEVFKGTADIVHPMQDVPWTKHRQMVRAVEMRFIAFESRGLK